MIRTRGRNTTSSGSMVRQVVSVAVPADSVDLTSMISLRICLVPALTSAETAAASVAFPASAVSVAEAVLSSVSRGDVISGLESVLHWRKLPRALPRRFPSRGMSSALTAAAREQRMSLISRLVRFVTVQVRSRDMSTVSSDVPLLTRRAQGAAVKERLFPILVIHAVEQVSYASA